MKIKLLISILIVSTLANASDLNVEGNLDVTGRIGIGRANPSYKLDVVDSTSISTFPLRIHNGYGTPADVTKSGMLFTIGDGRGFASISGGQLTANTYGWGRLDFDVRTDDTVGLQTKMSILANGHVGLGVKNPKSLLEIKGGHSNSRIQLLSDSNNQGYDGANTASLTLWASEPLMTWTGTGIGNNASTGVSGVQRLTTTRGGSYIRLADNAIGMHSIDSTGVQRKLLSLDPNEVDINTNLHIVGNTKIDGELELQPSRVLKKRDAGQLASGRVANLNDFCYFSRDMHSHLSAFLISGHAAAPWPIRPRWV